jgi:hypothetical protein
MAHLIIVDSPPPSITFTDVDTTQRDGSGAHTHAGLSFGAVNPTRCIIAQVAYGPGTGGSLSCSIGGVSASRVVTVTDASGWILSLWIAKVPTGSSGSVVLSGISGNWSSECSVFAALYLRSTTAVDTDTDANLTANLSVSVPAQGVIVAMGHAAAFGAVGTNTWSGVPRDFTQSFVSNNVAMAGGSQAYSSATTASVAASWSNAGSSGGGVMASFR